MADRIKPKRQAKHSEELHYKHFTYLNRPILQPSIITIESFSRLFLRSPTPSSQNGDPISINPFISVNEISTPITNETISEDGDFRTEGFDLNRFISAVDEHFICSFCKKVVRKPQECIYCQNLMCKTCISMAVKCPFGCENLFVKSPSKFALISYMKLKIKCVHCGKGCEVKLSIKDIQDHEKDCEFSEVKCANVVCNNLFVRAKTQSETCSEICSIVCGFKRSLDTKPADCLLQEFVKLIENAKENIQPELQSDLDGLIGEAQKKKEEFEEFLRLKEELYNEVEDWRTLYHPGKWNQVIRWWSCCENKEKRSKGCTDIP